MAKKKNSLKKDSSPNRILIDSSPSLRIKGYDDTFPRPICLELCESKVSKSYESHVVKTLKAFSNKEKFEGKFVHPVCQVCLYQLLYQEHLEVIHSLFHQ